MNKKLPYKRINIEQGSELWKSFRKTYIGGSEASIIMDESPYMTPSQLWRQKLGLIPDTKETDAMRAGREIEPQIREWLEKQLNIRLENPVLVSTEVPFMLASVDGFNEDHNILAEIKLNNKELHEKIKSSGLIPECHRYQVQHNLKVTMADECLYVSYNNGDKFVIREKLDQELIKELITQEEEFINDLRNKKEPELTERDYINRESSDVWMKLSEEAKKWKKQQKEAEENLETIKEQLLSICDHHSSQGNGVKIHIGYPRGRINYCKIPELKDLNLEIYRDPPKLVSTLRIDCD